MIKEKIVIQYSRGDEECTCEFLHCIEYESKQKLIDDLETATLQTAEEDTRLQAEYSRWESERPAFDGRKSGGGLSPEKMKDWLLARPANQDAKEVKFAGLSIPLDVLVNEYAIFYTLDEWFNSRSRR